MRRPEHLPPAGLHDRAVQDAPLPRLETAGRVGLSPVAVTKAVRPRYPDLKAHSGVTAPDLIAGHRRIVERAHDAGTCVVVSTIAPFRGRPEWDAAGEAVRQEVNAGIRSHSEEFDAVTDFDRVLRSPYDHERMLPVFDGGDHIHPHDKGTQAMADAVDLNSLDGARH